MGFEPTTTEFRSQRPTEKPFLSPNDRTMSDENLFVVKPEAGRESRKFYLLIHFLIESNNKTPLNLKNELFINNIVFFLFLNHNNMEKHLSLYFFFFSMKRSKCQTSVLLKNLSFIQIKTIWKNICSFYFFLSVHFFHK